MTQTNARPARLQLDPLLIGLYAWTSTVAVPALSPDAPAPSPWLASVALAALFVSWAIAVRRGIAADLLLAFGFIGSSFAAWGILGHARLAANLAELRTIVGAIGWGLFVLAWVRARQTARAESPYMEAQDIRSNSKSLGLAGNLHLAIGLGLVFAVFSVVGLQNANGRGVLVTTLALGWSIWQLDTSALLATRLEHQSRGLGFGLFAEPRMLLALGLAGLGYITGKWVAP